MLTVSGNSAYSHILYSNCLSCGYSDGSKQSGEGTVIIVVGYIKVIDGMALTVEGSKEAINLAAKVVGATVSTKTDRNPSLVVKVDVIHQLNGLAGITDTVVYIICKLCKLIGRVDSVNICLSLGKSLFCSRNCTTPSCLRFYSPGTITIIGSSEARRNTNSRRIMIECTTGDINQVVITRIYYTVECTGYNINCALRTIVSDKISLKNTKTELANTTVDSSLIRCISTTINCNHRVILRTYCIKISGKNITISKNCTGSCTLNMSVGRTTYGYTTLSRYILDCNIGNTCI